MSQPEKFVSLTMEQFKSLPGYTTEKSGKYWRGQCISLFEEIGARGYGFKDGNLAFQLDVEVADGSRKEVTFRIRPAMISVKTQRRGHAVQNVPKEGASWKIIYEYMRYKIALLRVGVLDVMETLGGNVVMLTDEGGVVREITFGEILQTFVEQDRLNQVIQLEDKR